MNKQPNAIAECRLHRSLNQRTRFGTRELLIAMLLSSIAFASQPAVGWKAAACMMCVALTLVMGWGSVALVASIAALSIACCEPNAGVAVSVCVAALLTIAMGPIALHKLSKFFPG